MWKWLNVHRLHGRDLRWLMINRSSGQRQKYEFIQISSHAWENVRSCRSKSKMGRSSGRVSTNRFFQILTWKWWTTDWVRVEFFHRTNVTGNPPEKSRKTCTYVHGQWYWLDEKRKFRTMCFKFRTSQELREEILAGALDIPWTWEWKEMVWKPKSPSWRKMASHSQPDGGMIRGIWIPSIQKCFSAGSWNPEETEQQGDYTLHCGSFEHSAFKSNKSLGKSAQYPRSSWKLVWKFGLKPHEKPPKAMNDKKLKGVQSQEENSLVKAPRNEEPATGNRFRECEQNFGTLETEVQFTRFCKQAAFIHKVAVGKYYRTGLDVDDGFGVRTPACRYTGLRADSLLPFDKEHYFDQFFKIILSSVLAFMELTFRDHPRLHLRGRHG